MNTNKRFLLPDAIMVILILMVGSVAYGPYGTTDEGYVHLGLYNLSHTPMYLLLTGLRIAAALIVTAFLSLPTLKYVLNVTSWQTFINKIKEQHNNSHVIIMAGFLLGGAFLAKGTPLSTWDAYLALLVYRGGIAVLVSIVITIVIAYAFGVRSFDEFKTWVDMPSNDSHAIIVAVVFAAVMFIAAV